MEPGSLIGAYRLVEPLGAGGMGAVWLAEHAILGRRAALKLLKREYAARPDIVARFFNEARAATSVVDPGIVQIYDFGHHDGSPFIAMELLEGEPLDVRLRRERVLPVEPALRIVRQAASTVGAAHAAGIVHRDLKPENIFLVRDPELPGGERAKILDFGIAKLGERSNVKTQTAVVMGTPLYMSPEQCRGAGEVDARADVYSLGCVLFSLVTGRPPFDGAGGGELIAKHLFEEPPRASTLVELPAAVDDLIDNCLSKDPGARLASGKELAAAIDLLLLTGSFSPEAMPRAADAASAATEAPSPTPPSAAITVPRSPATTASGSRRATPTRSRVPVLAGLVLVAGGAVAGAYVAARGRDPAPPVARDEAAKPAEPAITVRPIATELDVTKQRIATAFTAFTAWAVEHAGSACPTAGELGELLDGWSRPMRVTCTDQPSDQRLGIVSDGPDGERGTADDVASWLHRELAAQVRGPRWQAARPAPEVPRRQRPRRPARKPARRGPEPVLELDSDGVPVRR